MKMTPAGKDSACQIICHFQRNQALPGFRMLLQSPGHKLCIDNLVDIGNALVLCHRDRADRMTRRL